MNKQITTLFIDNFSWLEFLYVAVMFPVWYILFLSCCLHQSDRKHTTQQQNRDNAVCVDNK